NPRNEPEVGSLALERRTRRPLAPDLELPFGKLRSGSRECGEEPIESLLGAEPSEPQDEVRRPSPPRWLRRELRPGHGVREDPVDSPGCGREVAQGGGALRHQGRGRGIREGPES